VLSPILETNRATTREQGREIIIEFKGTTLADHLCLVLQLPSTLPATLGNNVTRVTLCADEVT
jgi:hypothetical protein